MPHNGGWAVKQAGSDHPASTHPTQSEAVRAARAIVSGRGGGDVVVHSRSGRVRESYTLGRDSFAKISAVEGIRLSREARSDFQEFDSKGLSASQRRRRIVRKYGKPT
jgi:hypothetical protein